jgi:nucleoside-diphosphate-sugar epimerase
MGMHVLVTDGAGYLGSILCARLLESGYQVTAVDKLIYGQQSLLHLCHCALDTSPLQCILQRVPCYSDAVFSRTLISESSYIQ